MKRIAVHRILALAMIAGAPFVYAAAGVEPARGHAPDQAAPPLRPGMPLAGGPQAGLPPLLATLDLSEAQQDKLFEIHYRQQPAVYAQTKAARKAREALRALIGSAEYTPARAQALAQAAARAEAELALIRAQIEHEALAVLDEEQRKLFAERRERRSDAPGDMPPPARGRGEAGPGGGR